MRHFIVSMIISFAIPVFGALVVLGGGFFWEWYSHGMHGIPDDEDTNNDLRNNLFGALIGSIIGFALLLLGLHPFFHIGG